MISFSTRVMREYKKYITKSNMQAVSSTIAKSQQSCNITTEGKTVAESTRSPKLSPLATPYPSSQQITSISKKSQTSTKVLSPAKLTKKLEREQFLQIRAESNARFKDYLSSLPVLDYPDHYRIECISNLEEANKKILEITESEDTFGVDLEWPPTFVKGQPENKVSLVQICTSKTIVLIQLSRIPVIPTEVRRFFENKKIFKTGVNIGADGLKLYRDYGFVTNGLIELKDMAESSNSSKLDLSHLRSLKALTGMFLGQHMNKGKVRLSNWGKSELTPSQIKYAALDAYASYKLYVVLKELQNPSEKVVVKHLSDNRLQNPIKQTKQNSEPLHSNYKTSNNKSAPTSTTTIIRRKTSI